ncbi:MAG: polysaccharide biosynthesis tyrosine autokinase [Sedimentisphaerales bacterium]|nr:polysaccharide biosynthesis tyrosine autokinase [Sedimentisphaerales bacterium]
MIKQAVSTRTKIHDNGQKRLPQAVGLAPMNLLSILWRNRWIISVTMVVSLSIGFVYITKAAPTYTSLSRVYVEQSGPKILSEAEGVMTQSKNYLYTQAELLKSTPILSAAIEGIDTKRLMIFEKINNPVIYLREKALDVTVGKKDDIITISCDAPNPVEAAQLVNDVVDAYLTYHENHKRKTAAEVLKIFQKEKREREQELAETLKLMKDFKSQNVALAFEHRNSNIILDTLDRLAAEMTHAQFETIEAESAYETLKSLLEEPEGIEHYIEMEIAEGTYFSTANERIELKIKLKQLEDELTDLTSRAKPDHPWVQALQQKVDRVKKELADWDKGFLRIRLAIVEKEHEQAKEKEQQIARLFEDQREQAIQLQKQLSEYAILQSRWDQTKKHCDILDNRIEEINITEDAGCLNISILEPARPSEKPSGPQKAKYLTATTILGFILSIGLALLREELDQRLHSVDDITAVLDLPVLGTMPSLSQKHNSASLGQKVHLDPMSSWSEACRTIRTAVFFGAPKTRAKTILVTSPTQADGKSTLASNLAIAMAQAGQKTLILDADFRKSMQHKIFEVNHQDVGLSTILAGITPSADAIQSTHIETLKVLPCGPDVPNPSELLNSDVFAQLLEILSDRYDRIIIDSPPVMPIADALILAAICNITLLVVRMNKSTRKTSLHARDGLLGIGANVLGIVINDVPKEGHYGYYGTYGHYRNTEDSDRERPRKKVIKERKQPAVTVLDRAARFVGSLE